MPNGLPTVFDFISPLDPELVGALLFGNQEFRAEFDTMLQRATSAEAWEDISERTAKLAELYKVTTETLGKEREEQSQKAADAAYSKYNECMSMLLAKKAEWQGPHEIIEACTSEELASLLWVDTFSLWFWHHCRSCETCDAKVREAATKTYESMSPEERAAVDYARSGMSEVTIRIRRATPDEVICMKIQRMDGAELGKILGDTTSEDRLPFLGHSDSCEVCGQKVRDLAGPKPDAAPK